MILDMYIDEPSRNNYDYEFINALTMEITATLKDHVWGKPIFTYGSKEMKLTGTKRIVKPDLALRLEYFRPAQKVTARQILAEENTEFLYYRDYLSLPAAEKQRKKKDIPILVLIEGDMNMVVYRIGMENGDEPHIYDIMYKGKKAIALVDHHVRRGSGYKTSVFVEDPAYIRAAAACAVITETELKRKGRCEFTPYISALEEEKAMLDKALLSAYQGEEAEAHSEVL